MSTIICYNTRFLTSPPNFKKKKKKTKQNTEQTNKVRENSKHVMIAAHTLAVNMF